jgi:hypothetical protein
VTIAHASGPAQLPVLGISEQFQPGKPLPSAVAQYLARDQRSRAGFAESLVVAAFEVIQALSVAHDELKADRPPVHA